jgi:hypothetical protein
MKIELAGCPVSTQRVPAQPPLARPLIRSGAILRQPFPGSHIAYAG